MASRCPQRFAFAASVSRATSASVRYSRVRSSELVLRTGTVRFTVLGVTSRKRDFAITIRLCVLGTVRITYLFRTVANGDRGAADRIASHRGAPGVGQKLASSPGAVTPPARRANFPKFGVVGDVPCLAEFQTYTGHRGLFSAMSRTSVLPRTEELLMTKM